MRPRTGAWFVNTALFQMLLASFVAGGASLYLGFAVLIHPSIDDVHGWPIEGFGLLLIGAGVAFVYLGFRYIGILRKMLGPPPGPDLSG